VTPPKAPGNRLPLRDRWKSLADALPFLAYSRVNASPFPKSEKLKCKEVSSFNQSRMPGSSSFQPMLRKKTISA